MLEGIFGLQNGVVGWLPKIFKAACTAVGQVFCHVALTVGNVERRRMLINVLKNGPTLARKVLDYSAGAFRAAQQDTKAHPTLEPISSGYLLPVHEFEILWVGKIGEDNCCYILTDFANQRRSGLDSDRKSMRLWIEDLLAPFHGERFIDRWARNHPLIYNEAKKAFARATADSPSLLDPYCEVLEKLRRSNRLFTIIGTDGPLKDIAQQARVRKKDFADAVIGLAVVAHPQAAAHWLTGIPSFATLKNGDAPSYEAKTRSGWVSVALLVGLDAGVRWSHTAPDGSVSTYVTGDSRKSNHPENKGIKNILGRPGIALHEGVGKDLYHLLGKLSPEDNGPAWVMLSSRKRGSGWGVMLPTLPCQLPLLLQQSGFGTVLREIVAIEEPDIKLTKADLLRELLDAFAVPAIRNSHQSVSEVVLAVRYALRRQRFPYSISQMIECVGTATRAVCEGSSSFGRVFCDVWFNENHGKAKGGFISNASAQLMIFARSFVLRLCQMASARWEKRNPARWGDGDEIDAIHAQRSARDLARLKSRGHPAKWKLPLTGMNALPFMELGPKESPSEFQSAGVGKDLENFLQHIFDLVMFFYKIKQGGLVLEQRQAERLGASCDATLFLVKEKLLRVPADDWIPMEDWIVTSPRDTKSVPIDVMPMLRIAAKSKRLRQRVADLQNVFAAADCGNAALLEKLIAFKTSDPLEILRVFSPAAMLRAIEPSREFWRQPAGKIMDRLGFKDERSRHALRIALRTTSFQGLCAILQAAALKIGDKPSGPIKGQLQVWVDHEKLMKAPQEKITPSLPRKAVRKGNGTSDAQPGVAPASIMPCGFDESGICCVASEPGDDILDFLYFEVKPETFDSQKGKLKKLLIAAKEEMGAEELNVLLWELEDHPMKTEIIKLVEEIFPDWQG
jgi:hypothetical protein